MNTQTRESLLAELVDCLRGVALTVETMGQSARYAAMLDDVRDKIALGEAAAHVPARGFNGICAGSLAEAMLCDVLLDMIALAVVNGVSADHPLVRKARDVYGYVSDETGKEPKR